MKSALAIRNTIGAPIANDNSGTPITSAAYVDLDSSLDNTSAGLQVFNTSTKAIKLAIGAAASEVDFYIIPPSAIGMIIPCEKCKKGARLSAKALGSDATTGFLVINFLG